MARGEKTNKGKIEDRNIKQRLHYKNVINLQIETWTNQNKEINNHISTWINEQVTK